MVVMVMTDRDRGDGIGYGHGDGGCGWQAVQVSISHLQILIEHIHAFGCMFMSQFTVNARLYIKCMVCIYTLCMHAFVCMFVYSL